MTGRAHCQRQVAFLVILGDLFYFLAKNTQQDGKILMT